MIDPGTLNAMQLPLVFLGGLLGSSHCIGMCGGFAVAMGLGTQTISANVARQVSWGCGRVVTYAFAGATAGYLGARIGEQFFVGAVQGGLALLAGALLVVQGLLAAGVGFRRRVRTSKCSLIRFTWLLPLRRLLMPATEDGSANRVRETFFAGLFTGFLPCGLVYAYLALAAASGGVWWGLTVMAVFGFGTMPVLIATGAGASLVRSATRARVFQVAAWCVLATGLLTIGRGINAISADAGSGEPECLLCEPAGTE